MDVDKKIICKFIEQNSTVSHFLAGKSTCWRCDTKTV